MEKINYIKKGEDIWLRARTNAFAHKLRYEKMQLNYTIIFIIQTISVVIPIVCNGIIIVVSSGTPSIRILSIVSIIAGGLVLLTELLLLSLNYQERKMVHKSMIANYSMLAQKARRFDHTVMDEIESKYLIQNLENYFEAYKAQGEEPSNKYFVKAKKMLEHMNVHPKFCSVEASEL